MLTAKIEYGFDQLTARSGGVLSGPAHVAMGRRAAAAIGYALGSADEARMIEAYLNIWQQAHLPHLPAGSRGLTKEEFVRSNLALADDPVTRNDTLGALASTFFELADDDGDGRVDREEFWAFQHGHFPELTRADLGEAFDHLDSDGDGYLSRGQFTAAIVEYWTGRDPDAPGNWWLGRPVYLRPDDEYTCPAPAEAVAAFTTVADRDPKVAPAPECDPEYAATAERAPEYAATAERAAAPIATEVSVQTTKAVEIRTTPLSQTSDT